MDWSAVVFSSWVSVTPSQLVSIDTVPDEISPYFLTVPKKLASRSLPLDLSCRILDESGRLVGYRLSASCEENN